MKFLVRQLTIFLEKDCLLTDRYFDGHDHSKNYNDNGSKTYLKQSKITIKYFRNYKKILNKKSVQSNVFSDCDYKELKIKLQILKF